MPFGPQRDEKARKILKSLIEAINESSNYREFKEKAVKKLLEGLCIG